MEALAHPVRGLLDPVIACVREVAAREVMPRYLKVAHQRKSDGSLFTAVVQQGRRCGVQFHPERSAAAGARILRNFLEMDF